VPSEQRAKTSVAPTSLTQGRAELLVLLAAVLFSTGGAGIKVSAFSAAQVSAMRSGIAAVALLAWTRRRVPLSWNLLFVGAVYAVTLTLFVAATRLTTAANAIFLQSTAPLYLLALGPLVLKERFGRREVLFVGVIFAGMLICLQDSPPGTLTAPDPATGNLLAALSAVVVRSRPQRGAGRQCAGLRLHAAVRAAAAVRGRRRLGDPRLPRGRPDRLGICLSHGRHPGPARARRLVAPADRTGPESRMDVARPR
jgi:hypothetical protein